MKLLGNIAQTEDGPLWIFDGIEFNAEFRWIDVISEIAFLAMDLEARDRPDYSHRLINRYLENTGDYAGLPLQIFWALLDVMTIVVLWSGLVLWWRKRKQPVETILREADRDAEGLDNTAPGGA